MKCIFKIASLLTFAAAVLLSCDKEQAAPVTTGPKIQDLGVSFDKNIIRNDGETVTLKAYYKGQDVSDQASFLQYIEGEELPQIMTSRLFSSDKTGEYRFQVAYGAATSDIVSVKVVDQAIPGRTADPQPANTSFVHRTFFNQHTGANCGYCPGMTKLLKDTFGEFETDPLKKAAKQEVREKVVLAALRTYGGGEAGFKAGAARIPVDQLIGIAQLKLAVPDGVHPECAVLLYQLMADKLPAHDGHIVGRGIVGAVIKQAAAIGKVGVFHAKLLGPLVHQLHKALFAAADMLRHCHSAVIC